MLATPPQEQLVPSGGAAAQRAVGVAAALIAVINASGRSKWAAR
jgi:hypothetical protein